MASNLCVASVSLVAAFAAAIAPAAVIHVPADAGTIAAAVALARDGDVIELEPGVYAGKGNRDVDIATSNLTIRGAAGAGSTVIDCGGTIDDQHRAFNVHVTGITLQGITIRHGFVIGNGAGALIEPDSDRRGYGSLVVSGCVFDSCVAMIGEWPADSGGALTIRALSVATIDQCSFVCNASDGSAAGLVCGEVGGLALTRSLFACNVNVGSDSTAGCSLAIDGWLTVDRCEFSHNSGAAWIAAFYPVISNCLIHDNAGALPGGFFGGNYLILRHTTFANNIAANGSYSEQIQSWNGYVEDSIIWDDDAYISHTEVFGCCLKLTSFAGTYGNTDVDPMFVDPDSENYRLQPSSPLVDYGSYLHAGSDPFDFDGNPRSVDIPDIPNGSYAPEDTGCYELQLSAPTADLDENGTVDAADLAILVGAWGPCASCAADLTGDGVVDGADLAELLAAWG